MSSRSRPLILIVDDEPINLRAIGDLLSTEGYALSFANSGRAALDAARSALPTLILLDISMPDIDGIEVCRRLKETAATADIPVIFITAHEHELPRAFAAGAVDYIRKPVNEVELRLRVGAHMRISQLIDQLAYSNQRLTEANYELSRLSTTDALTGLPNRRHFDDVMEAEWRRGVREGHPLSVLMLDIDHFKKINDEYGHPLGDLVLKMVAGAIKSAIQRGGDVVARYGGEEFVVVLPNTAAAAALQQAEKVRTAVAALDLSQHLPDVRVVTISVGLAADIPARDGDHATLLGRADKALYTAKLQGRNRVVSADSG